MDQRERIHRLVESNAMAIFNRCQEENHSDHRPTSVPAVACATGPRLSAHPTQLPLDMPAYLQGLRQRRHLLSS